MWFYFVIFYLLLEGSGWFALTEPLDSYLVTTTFLAG